MIGDRTIWRTVDLRAEDLRKDDVARNRYGKWDVITDVTKHESDHYVNVHFEVGGAVAMRRVHLVKVQVAKES